MQQASEAVATHSSLAHFIADYQGTAARCVVLTAKLRSKQSPISLDLAKHHPFAVVTTLRTV
jgi:hypothetical protein